MNLLRVARPKGRNSRVPPSVSGSVWPVNWLAFVASLVHSLAWPIGVVVVVIVLRQPIGAAFSRGVRRLRAGPVEVEFDQELAGVREELSRSPELAAAEPQVPSPSLAEELARLAEVSPRSAVLEAFARIEARLSALLDSADVESTGELAAGHWPGWHVTRG